MYVPAIVAVPPHGKLYVEPWQIEAVLLRTLHGGPVGTDPKLDEGLDRPAVGVDPDLHDLLVRVGKFPVLAGGPLDAHRPSDVGQVPLGGHGREGCGPGGGRPGGIGGEGVDRRGGGEGNEESGEEFHGWMCISDGYYGGE